MIMNRHLQLIPCWALQPFSFLSLALSMLSQKAWARRNVRRSLPCLGNRGYRKRPDPEKADTLVLLDLVMPPLTVRQFIILVLVQTISTGFFQHGMKQLNISVVLTFPVSSARDSMRQQVRFFSCPRCPLSSLPHLDSAGYSYDQNHRKGCGQGCRIPGCRMRKEECSSRPWFYAFFARTYIPAEVVSDFCLKSLGYTPAVAGVSRA